MGCGPSMPSRRHGRGKRRNKNKPRRTSTTTTTSTVDSSHPNALRTRGGSVFRFDDPSEDEIERPVSGTGVTYSKAAVTTKKDGRYTNGILVNGKKGLSPPPRPKSLAPESANTAQYNTNTDRLSNNSLDDEDEYPPVYSDMADQSSTSFVRDSKGKGNLLKREYNGAFDDYEIDIPTIPPGLGIEEAISGSNKDNFHHTVSAGKEKAAFQRNLARKKKVPPPLPPRKGSSPHATTKSPPAAPQSSGGKSRRKKTPPQLPPRKNSPASHPLTKSREGPMAKSWERVQAVFKRESERNAKSQLASYLGDGEGDFFAPPPLKKSHRGGSPAVSSPVC